MTLENLKKWLNQNKKLVIIYSVLVVLLTISSGLSPTFRSIGNIGNLLHRATPLLVIALGQTMAVLLTGLDLSVGPMASLATVIVAVSMGDTLYSIALSVGLVLLVGCLVGGFNGVAISKLKIHPLIATLSTMAIVQGISLWILPQPGGNLPDNFVDVMSFKVGPFSVSFMLFVIIAAGLYVILNHTPFGRHVYAVGGKEESASVSGLPVDRIKISVFTMSGLLAAFGGLVLSTRIASGDPTVGAPLTLDSLTAVLMGGTTFAGGRGGIGGSIAGVLILIVLKNIFNFVGVHAYWQHVFRGVILMAAILAYSLRSTR